MSIEDANRHGQQLFLANLHVAVATHEQRAVRARTQQQLRPSPPKQATVFAPVAHRQLVLFDLERDLVAGRAGGFNPPPHPGIARHVLVTGGDVRRACDLFGLTIAGAARYVSVLSHPELDGGPTRIPSQDRLGPA